MEECGVQFQKYSLQQRSWSVRVIFVGPAAPWSRADVIPRHGGGGNTESALWFCRAQGGQLYQMPAPVSNALSVEKKEI